MAEALVQGVIMRFIDEAIHFGKKDTPMFEAIIKDLEHVNWRITHHE